MVSKFVHSFQTNLNNVSVQVHWTQARPQICTFFGALNSLIHDSISDMYIYYYNLLVHISLLWKGKIFMYENLLYDLSKLRSMFMIGCFKVLYLSKGLI